MDQKFINLDLKEVSDSGEFEGYASKFGIRDQGGDVVERGAFKTSLSQRGPEDVKMLWQHDPSQPIGVWESIKEDDVGLRVKGRLLLAVSKAKETYELMKAGVVSGMSIGYKTVKAFRDDQTGFRQLKELDLWEISAVTFPMLKEAQITGVKQEFTKRDVEEILRDAGLPNSMAVKLIAGGWDAADTSGIQRDADEGLTSIMQDLRNLNSTMKGRLQ